MTGAAAQGAADRLRIRFPILLDPKGTAALRFSANEFPAYVLLDARGIVRRRLVGFRSGTALAAMVDDAAKSR